MALDIIDFLNDRISEDELAATAASQQYDVHGINRGPGVWWVTDLDDDETRSKLGGCRVLIRTQGGPNKVYSGLPTMLHIARHDPVRAMRDAMAKRAILKVHNRVVDSWEGKACGGCGRESPCDDWIVEDVDECPTLQALASIYVSHPDFDPRWKF